MRSVLVVAAVLAFAGCEVNLNSEGIVSRETKKFTVGGRPDVDVSTFEGSIDIHSWDRNEVEIEIEKRAMDQSLVDQMKVVAEQHGDKVVLKVTGPADRGGHTVQIGVHFSPTARLRVVVPRQSVVSAKSEDGSITVEDVDGKVALNTSDGSVRVTRVSGELVVRSGDGAIRMEGVQGKVDLETDDGSIAGEATPTSLRAHTGDGSIRIEVKADSKMDSDWDVQTSDGSVVLTLPADFNGQVDAESRDGSVRANHPAIKAESNEGEGQRERRHALRATMGSGGKVLRVRTGDGSIRIES